MLEEPHMSCVKEIFIHSMILTSLISSTLSIPPVPRCICPRVYMPVCANSRTFKNYCQFDCENRKRVAELLPHWDISCYAECDKCRAIKGLT